jgi:cystathionine beta-lyase family protein involved in aluminum resistance
MGANQSMIEALKMAANKMNQDSGEAVANFQEACEKNKEARMKKNAAMYQTNGVTDTMSTGNTGFGAEAVIGQVWTDEMYSMISQLP